MSHSRTVDGPGFKIRYTDEAGYLRAHVFDGVDSQAVSIAMWQLLGQECQRLQATHLLVLEELQGCVGSAEVDAVNRAMPETGLQSVRIAFVELLVDGVGENEYGEILCQELGMTIRVFTNAHEARRWLLYGS